MPARLTLQDSLRRPLTGDALREAATLLAAHWDPHGELARALAVRPTGRDPSRPTALIDAAREAWGIVAAGGSMQDVSSYLRREETAISRVVIDDVERELRAQRRFDAANALYRFIHDLPEPRVTERSVLYAPSRSDDRLTLRIVVRNPVAGVALAMQSGKDQLLMPVRVAPDEIVFEESVRIARDTKGALALRGPIIQGPPAKRFVYITIGRSAGQYDSPWTRRTKVPLGSVTQPLIEGALAAGGVLEAEYEGTARDGSPACATVPLRTDWHVGR